MSVLDQPAASSGWSAQTLGTIRTRRTTSKYGSVVIAQTTVARVDRLKHLTIPAGEDDVVISHASRDR
ncbi:MAG: AraC family transcriptional regulator, partial [Bradyrhizobium sp.]|nr:AraC family transcriptional regulator [Bradyrhizobium sp.]